MAQLRWSRKLRERLGLAVERSEDGVLLALLYLDQWRCVWQADKVADLLDAAATGEAAAVWAVVAAAIGGKHCTGRAFIRGQQATGAVQATQLVAIAPALST